MQGRAIASQSGRDGTRVFIRVAGRYTTECTASVHSQRLFWDAWRGRLRGLPGAFYTLRCGLQSCPVVAAALCTAEVLCTWQASGLDSYAKQWRLFADVFNNIGMRQPDLLRACPCRRWMAMEFPCSRAHRTPHQSTHACNIIGYASAGYALELASPLYPRAFLLVACLGSIARSITGVWPLPPKQRGCSMSVPLFSALHPGPGMDRCCRQCNTSCVDTTLCTGAQCCRCVCKGRLPG